MDFHSMHEYMLSLVERGVPGLELMVCRNHEVLFHECAGFSDYDRTRAAASSDLYWIYSCSKPITVTAAMQCIEKGLFSLDDEVAQYLPSYKDAFTMVNGEHRPLSHPMTIRHLFTMTGGLDYDLNRPAVAEMNRQTGNKATTMQLADAMAKDALSFEPGERFQYSLCHDVLGGIIEKVSGMTLREYMKENIFEPLGMTHTDFYANGQQPENMAAQYKFNVDTKAVMPISKNNPFVLSDNYCSGGAGLVSCCEDLAKFADAMACGGVSKDGKRILTMESIDLMRSEQLPSFGADASFSCACGSDYGYGLGVRTRIAFKQGVYSSPGEFGWDGAAGANLMMDPENKLSISYVQHVKNWPFHIGKAPLDQRDILYTILGK